jgi:hypothetical protein
MKAMSGEPSVLATEKLTYELTQTHIDDSEEMRYTTYGVRARDGSGACVFDCADISTSREYVAGFIGLVQDRDVAAVHIADILEDYLD